MKWHVLYHTTSDEIKECNIFDNVRFKRDVDKALKGFITYDTFKEDIRSALSGAFRGKYEYEIMCKGLFQNNKEYKIDIYKQVLPNLDILCKYIIEEHNAESRKKV